MFILSYGVPLENCKDKDYRVIESEIEKKYRDAGYSISERRYKITERDDYSVICPEYRNKPSGLEPVVILPDFVVPGRRYPVYVYLYAIDLYSANPDKGQRWAAAATRRYFGLTTFAHTTLGRALKAFVRNTEDEAADEDAFAEGSTAAKAAEFPTAQATGLLRKKAARFFQGRLATAPVPQKAAAIGCKLARECFKRHRRFLL